ncbi:MAG: ribulose-phosphate 3-epimerase [Anaerolineaceae bacterium]|nr:ribulose-phosphate 3-epimerase [Anaerolineaceae bacterium]
MNKYLLSASVLSADFANLAQQIKELELAGVDWIHVDVMDGHFVPNISMGPFIVETIKRITNLPLDVHLMIDKPENYIQDFINAGASTLSIHIENNSNVHRTLQTIRASGCKPGVVLNPGTPAIAISSVISEVDLVLVMSVNPGFSGQKFLPQSLKKITEIRKMLKENNADAWCQVDGGIDSHNISACYNAGANVFVAASSIFKSPQGIAGGVQILRNPDRE